MGTTLTTMQFSWRPRRASSAAARTARSPKTTRSAASDWGPDLLGPVLPRHLDGRLDRSADAGLRDLLVGDRYLLCADGPGPGRRRPNALLCTNFACHIRRRADQLAALAGAGPACPG